MIPSQRLRFISSFINQKDRLPPDVTRQEWHILRALMPGPLAFDYLRRLTIRMAKGISGTWKT